jgi:hypothetical protein
MRLGRQYVPFCDGCDSATVFCDCASDVGAKGREAGVDAGVDALIVLQLTSGYHGVLSGLELIVAQLESLPGDYIT